MELLRIIVAILLPPLGVFLQVGIAYRAKTTKPSELRVSVLLAEGVRNVRVERVVLC